MRYFTVGCKVTKFTNNEVQCYKIEIMGCNMTKVVNYSGQSETSASRFLLILKTQLLPTIFCEF